MVPVISQTKWMQWCSERQLPIATALFALDSCYYGLGFRTRPGTLVLTETDLIHYSYSWRQSLWAIFEPSVLITIPVVTLLEVRRIKLSFGLKVMHGRPESAFRVTTSDGQKHDLVLQRRGDEFAQALDTRGFTVPDESNPA